MRKKKQEQTPYQKIIRAAERHDPLRLTMKDVQKLSFNQSIIEIAQWDDVYDQEQTKDTDQ